MCIGGTTGIEACPPKIITEIKVDTNARDCVDSILKTILSKADDISLCVSDLMSMANVNSSAALTRLASLNNYKINISETFIRDVTAYDVNGNEISTRTNGITDNNGNIGLNQLMLNDATDLGVAATMIHELMHSYFVYGINHTSGNEQFFFSTMNTFLFDKNGVPNQNQASAQHTQMATTYVNSMASLLSRYAQSRGIITSPDSSISLLEYCKDIFWKNLSYSQAYVIAPNKTRAVTNADREYKNQSNSSRKKGC
jgi:predicted SprT family Zn-dependent metalloprotease